MNDFEVKITNEFLWLMFPRKTKARNQLEDLVLNKGYAEVTIWKNHIVDGYDEYMIAKDYDLPISYIKLKYFCKEKVKAWICEKQAMREDLPKETRWYCIGKRYSYEKDEAPKGKIPPRATKDEKDRDGKSMTDMALEYEFSRNTLNKYFLYSIGIDHVRESLPELADALLEGKVFISQENIAELVCLTDRELKKLYEHLVIQKKDFSEFKQHRGEFSPPKTRRASKMQSEKPTIAIKNMPEYDPDAELSSLCLTIPSWISSIERVKKNVNLTEVSDNARINTFMALYDLNSAAEGMQDALRGKEK